MEKLTRRGLITGLISFGVAAPAIVKFSSLMPVKVMVDYPMTQIWGWYYHPYRDGWLVFGKDTFGRDVTEFIPSSEVEASIDRLHPHIFNQLRKTNDQRSGVTGGL